MSISTSDFDKPQVIGARKTRRVKFDITSYSSEESVTASDVGLKKLDDLELLGAASDTGHVWEWDQANKQIKAFTADYDAASDGPLIEASGTTDVGAMWVRAYGK